MVPIKNEVFLNLFTQFGYLLQSIVTQIISFLGIDLWIALTLGIE